MEFNCGEAYTLTTITVFEVTILTIFALTCLVAVVTTIVIFGFRKKYERPLFVIL